MQNPDELGIFNVNRFIENEMEKGALFQDGRELVTRDVAEDVARQACLNIIQDKATLIDNLSNQCHAASVAGGWWNDIQTGEDLHGKRNVGELMMLMVSEIAEGFEGVRKNLPSDKLPGFSNEEEEMADLLIRLGDFAGARKLRLGAAVVAKMAYNASREDHKRENRLKADGKKF